MDLIEVKNRKDGFVARHPWELARFEVVNELLKSTIRNDSEFSILDIGCGDIFFISQLSSLYPKVKFYAIDIAFTDEIIGVLSKEIGGKNIYLFKTLNEANAHLKGHADLVLLLDVVEHIEDDHQFLMDLHQNRAITSNTTIMITVPAFQALFYSHDHFLGHYRRYTNKTLLKTIQDSGFEKVDIGYFFMSLLPPRLLQVIKEKIVKPDLNQKTTGLVEWNKGRVITNFMKTILVVDYKLNRFIKNITGSSIIGLSNYVICKKPA